MNETMAPMEHSNGLKRRDDLTKELSKRKRDGVFGGGFADGSKRGNGGGGGGGGFGNGNSNNNDNGNNKSDGNGKDGGGNDHEPFSSPLLFSNTAAKPTSIAQTTSTAVTPVPTTVVITSTSAAAAAAQPTSTAAVSSSTSISSTSSSPSPASTLSITPTFISSMFPTSAAAASITTSLADTSSQPRKSLNTDGDDPFASPTKTKNNHSSAAATALAETAPASTTSSSLELPAQAKEHHGGRNHGLSPTSEHVLIALGAIGAFIILMALVYFVAWMKKIDLFSKGSGREFSRGGPRGWYGWRERDSREMDYTTDGPPPKYTGYDESFEYPSEQKPVPAQRQLEAFFSPTAMPPLATPESAAALSRADTRRQETVREALLDNPAPFGVSPPQPTEQSATQTFNQNASSYDPNGTYNPNLTYNSNVAVAAGLSRQTSDAYDPAQREVNHMSYLSSLSSGFGDQIIIPDAGPMKPNNARVSRQSYRQSRKFSWATSARGPQGDRDTIYTTASIDSTPARFRTINSWVAQQTGRVQRQQQAVEEVPKMPEIPKPLQAGVAPAHQRNQSEDPALKHHPGDEIEIARGLRIPRTILDKKFGIN